MGAEKSLERGGERERKMRYLMLKEK